MKRIIIVLAIVMLLIVGYFTSPFLLELFDGGEYHTGFNMDDVNNCETVHERIGCLEVVGTWGCWYGNVEADYAELISSPMNNAPVITVMQSGTGERSIDITVTGTLSYLGIPTRHWNPDWGWYTVEISYGKDLLGNPIWKTIIDTKDDRIDQSIVGQLVGSRTKQKYRTRDSEGIIPGLPQFFVFKSLDPIVFNIKDSQVGIIRVRQHAEFSALLGLLRETKTCSIDYAFLVSGKGTVEKVDEQDRYIAGEDKVRFEVNTGYSGYTVGGEYVARGWVLKVYNNRGIHVKSWDIDDDKRGSRYDKTGSLLDYEIPLDAVNPGESHTWRVVLTNTLFDQDHEQFFVVTRAELEQAPDIKPIEFSEADYHLGDTVTVYLEGIPNPDGRNKIDGFLVNIKYGRSGWTIDYVEDYHLKYISATGSKATISFRSSKGDTYVTVEAWAFDSPEVTGGIMSEGATGQVWIKDKESSPPDEDIDWLPLAVAIIVFIIFLIIAMLPQIPIPYGMYGRMMVVVLGAVLAVIIYWYMGGDMGGIV